MHFSHKTFASLTAFSLAFGLVSIFSSPKAVEAREGKEGSVQVSQENFARNNPTALTFSFSALNQKKYSFPIYYVVVFEPEDQLSLPFTQVIRQTATLSPGSPMEIQGAIPVPTFLAGNYSVFVEIQSPSGAVLGTGERNTISFSATNPVSIKGCLAGTSNLTRQVPFEIDESGTVPEIVCVLNSIAKEDGVGTYTVRGLINEYSLTGKEVSRQVENISLSKNEEGVVRFQPITNGLKPGAYVMSFEVRNEKIELVTPPVVVTVNVKGTSAKLLSTTPDKTSYKKGDTAVLALDLRPTPENPQADMLFVQSEMKDMDGTCGKSESFTWTSPEENIRIPLQKDCSFYQVTTTVKDRDGKVLDTLVENFGYYSTGEQTGVQSPENAMGGLGSKMKVAVLILVGLGVLGLAWYLVRRHRKEKEGMIYPPRS